MVIDSAKHVSRMLAALSSLERMKKEATKSVDVRARYLAAFEATHQVLLALLERVPEKVLEVARPLALKIPHLSME